MKSDRERQITYNSTYIWNLKNNVNKKTKQMVSRWERGWKMGEKGEGIKKHKLPVIKMITGI